MGTPVLNSGDGRDSIGNFGVALCIRARPKRPLETNNLLILQLPRLPELPQLAGWPRKNAQISATNGAVLTDRNVRDADIKPGTNGRPSRMTATMSRVQPFPSFDIVLPDAVVHQADEQVASYWLDGGALLLQLSSYAKPEGSPIPAKQRMQERIAKSSGRWKMWDRRPLISNGAEQAIAETVDSEGLLWIHAYFVWPSLTVYATISGPEDEVSDTRNWAITALDSMKPNPQ